MRKLMALALVAVTVLAACSGGEGDNGEKKGAPTGACPTLSPPVTNAPKLPAKFPSPPETTFTAVSKAGPSTVVEGYANDDLGVVYRTYKTAFKVAHGYTLTKSEHDPRDAELDWSGHKTTGEVKMDWPCQGLTQLEITIRPA